MNVVLSAGKVMASVHWVAKSVIMVDYLTKGETITSAYYCTLLRRLRNEIKEFVCVFHQDNTGVHTSVESLAQIRDCSFVSLPHSAYSPNSNFYLFPNPKKNITEDNFSSNEEVEPATYGYFEELEESFFKNWFKSFEKQVKEMQRARWKSQRKIKIFLLVFNFVFG